MHLRLTCLVSVMLFLGSVCALSQDLKSGNNRADYVVIAPASYMPQAERLAKFRHTSDGLVTMAVSIDSIVGQFNASAASDSALRDFIQFALRSWQSPKPEYFVLAGNVNAIPSHVEAEDSFLVHLGYRDSLCIDHWFVEDPSRHTWYGNALAVLGRLPAWDSAGLAVMIEKQIEYESLVADRWWGRCVGLADDDTTAPGLFDSDLQRLQQILAAVWQDTLTVDVGSSSPRHRDSLGFREIWNEGASIMTYCGHANPYTLSATRYFTTRSVDALTNGNRLPVCFFGGCDLRFDTANPSSIPVHLLEQPAAGAVACVASAGVTFESSVVSEYAALFRDLINTPTRTVGRAFTNAKNACADGFLRRLTFLGDPALRIKRPEVVAGIPVRQSYPAETVLYQNYPNPFNPGSEIRFQISRISSVRLAVYDLLGREVAVLVNEKKAPGSYVVRFDAMGLASGVYIYRLTDGQSTIARRMLLLK